MAAHILLLPGFACTSQIWQPVRARLEPYHTLTLVDWPTGQTPGFHTVEDFSAWLSHQFDPQQYDLVAGHSLGGLVALDWLARLGQSGPHLVLVESFLLPPPPFFRNLLVPGADPELAQSVTGMLSAQRDFFSPRLQEALRLVDRTSQAAALHGRIQVLYGDRGSPDPAEALQALGWPEWLRQCAPITWVAGACHFPMLENPDAVAGFLARMVY